jgi:hypothetical protein
MDGIGKGMTALAGVGQRMDSEEYLEEYLAG